MRNAVWLTIMAAAFLVLALLARAQVPNAPTLNACVDCGAPLTSLPSITANVVNGSTLVFTCVNLQAIPIFANAVCPGPVALVQGLTDGANLPWPVGNWYAAFLPTAGATGTLRIGSPAYWIAPASVYTLWTCASVCMQDGAASPEAGIEYAIASGQFSEMCTDPPLPLAPNQNCLIPSPAIAGLAAVIPLWTGVPSQSPCLLN